MSELKTKGLTAWETIQSKAKELAKNNKISVAEAIDKVLQTEPQLYVRYLREPWPKK